MRSFEKSMPSKDEYAGLLEEIVIERRLGHSKTRLSAILVTVSGTVTDFRSGQFSKSELFCKPICDFWFFESCESVIECSFCRSRSVSEFWQKYGPPPALLGYRALYRPTRSSESKDHLWELRHTSP